MNLKVLICLWLLRMGLLLLPQALLVGVAQADSIAQADSVVPQIACDRCDVSYPEEARLARLSGRVSLLIDIDADGRVTNVRLAQSSGYSILDQNAIETAATWQFQPFPEGARGLSVVIDYVVDGGILEEP